MKPSNHKTNLPDDDRLGQLVHDYVAGIHIKEPTGDEWQQKLATSPMTLARRPAVAAFGAAAVVVTVVLTISLLRLQIDGNGGTSNPSIDPIGSSLSGGPSPEASEDGGSAAADLSQYGWFSLQAFLGCPRPAAESATEAIDPCADPAYPRDSGWGLRVGLLNAQYRELKETFPGIRDPMVFRRAMPFGTMAGRDSVLFGYFDGSESSLSLLTASSESREILWQSDLPVSSAVMHLASGRFFAAVVDSGTRRDAGIWVGQRGGGEPSRLIPPRTDLAADQEVNGWERSMYLSPNGTRLAVVDCQDRRCGVMVHDTGTGALVTERKDLRQDAIFGISDASLFGLFSCSADPCEVSALSLETGELARIPTEGCPTGYGVVTSDGRQQVLLVAVQLPDCGGRSAVVAWDPASGPKPVEFRGVPEAEFVAATSSGSYAVPSGWVLMGIGGEIAPVQGDRQGPWLVAIDGAGSIDLRFGQ